MADIPKQRIDPETVLPVVSDATIARFEQLPHDNLALSRTLASDNFNLSVWLRQRALELAPELQDREVITQLALETAALLATQATVNKLRDMFNASSGEGSEEAIVKQVRQNGLLRRFIRH